MAGFILLNDSTQYGTNGDDTFTAGPAGATNAGAIGRDGNDTFDLGSTNPNIGTVNDSTVLGGFGEDTVSGLGSADLVYGNQNDDTILLNGSGNNNSIYGGQGDDFIGGPDFDASGGSFLIYGNRNNDFINLFGAGGSSTVYGGADNDTIIGGFGSDTAGDSLIGGQGDDTIIGIAPATTIYGDFAGATEADGNDDIILSLGGTSTVYGGYGSDIVGVTGSGNVAYGNQGNDYLVDAGDLFTTGTNTGGSSTLYGGQGEDFIATSAAFGANGFTQNDVIYGNLGNDLIFTSDGDGIGDQATVYGGQGNDQIIANNNDSQLTGGLGADSYFLNGSEGFANAPPQAITVTDFVSGEDRVTFGGDQGTSFNYTEVQQTGGLNEAYVAAAQSNSEYTFVAGSTNGYLFYNPNADGNGGNPGDTGDLQVVQLNGLNNVNDFASTDIFGGTAPTPENFGFARLQADNGAVENGMAPA